MSGKSKTPSDLIVDWQQVVLTLRARYGKSLHTIAREIGSNEHHLRRLARGETQQPKFDTGIKLLDLLRDVCPDVNERTRLALLPEQARLL